EVSGLLDSVIHSANFERLPVLSAGNSTVGSSLPELMNRVGVHLAPTGKYDPLFAAESFVAV
ncbi:MAG: hypothetical protein VYC98_04825, partial [Planctomycetota bacterium]|nr:hypothetical protein [Planctomycetota bacterium]